MSLKKNLFHNIFGVIFPLILAFISTPFLIKGLGVEQYGLLTIAWIFMGYFGFLDFGISRALTNLVAKNRDEKLLPYAWSCIWTSFFLLLFISFAVCIAIHLNMDAIVHHVAKDSNLNQIIEKCFFLINASIPIVICNGLQKGALEGFERFDLINKIRVPMSLWSYSAPVVLLPFTNSVVDVVIFLIIGRLITSIFYFMVLKKLYVASPKYSKTALAALINTGGWIGFSSIMSPLMIYIDRFVIASKVSLSSVAYYTTPMDAITKLLQPVDAISGVFFPALSRAALSDKDKFNKLYVQSFELLSILLFSGCALLILFGRYMLSIWLGDDFANHSYLILQVLAIGVFANGVARSPWGVIQASGSASFTALFQLAQILPYFAILYYLSNSFGILGVAIAWTARVVFDFFGLVLKAKNYHVFKLSLMYIIFLFSLFFTQMFCFFNIFILSFVSIVFFCVLVFFLHKEISPRYFVDLCQKKINSSSEVI